MGPVFKSGEEVSEITLESVCEDIFNSWEKELVQDKGESIDYYFENLTRTSALAGQSIDTEELQNLSQIVKNDFILLYKTYSTQKKEILEQQQNRKLWKYVLGTIAVLEVVGAVLTRGGNLRPGALLPTVIFESVVGGAMYGAMSAVDNFKINRAKKKLFSSVRTIQKQLTTRTNYRLLTEESNATDAEMYLVLNQYGSNSDPFWRDYHTLRSADPTTKKDYKKMELPYFADFMYVHTQGKTSSELRKQRFDDLFIYAQKYFVNQQENYALQFLEENERLHTGDKKMKYRRG